MEIFLVILVMLAVIALSNIVNHVIPSIPVPLIQVAMGFMIAALPGGFDVPIEPELFFVLFIAPILYNDGKNVSKRALWNLRKEILLLVLGLVFLTVLVIGYLTHWLIPSIPLSAAFALAAILSPTDIVAVNAMSCRIKIPDKVLHLLEGEGLMNDASGLVAFHFAIAATVTGAFSLADASLSFLEIALGGFAGGAILAFFILRFSSYIRRLGMEDVTFHMLIQILTPFIVYLVIEHFELSGILAVVAAGIVHALERDHGPSLTINMKIVSKSTWSVVLYILNGLVFVLLGLQIPDILSEIFKNPNFDNLIVILYVLIISAALFLIRFLWMYFLEWNNGKLRGEVCFRPDLRMTAIATISGVRGAVTLAGAFSIPFVLADGSLFPQRSLIIFIAAGVILVTLMAASLILPMLAKSELPELENKRETDEKEVLLRSYESAIKRIHGEITDENRDTALKVIAEYHQKIHQLNLDGTAQSPEVRLLEKKIRLKALESESDYIAKLAEENLIDRETAILVQTQIRQMEAAVSNGFKFKILMFYALMKRIMILTFRILIPKKREPQLMRAERMEKIDRLRRELSEKAMETVKEGLTPENKEISYLIIGEYHELVARVMSGKKENFGKSQPGLEREMREKAFQAERDELQRSYEEGEISKEITKKVRQQINVREAYEMQNS